MRSLFYSLLRYFLTPAGLVVMGALDSSVIFFLPLGIDFAVVVVSARRPELFWLYAALATAGSVAGAMVTFWIGRKVGEHGLTLFIPRSRFERVRQRVSDHAALSTAALAIIPPPFPFTAFLLMGGALGANPWTFLTALAAVRALRFAVEAALAALYGRRILAWMETTTFEIVVGALIVLAISGTMISGVVVWRGTKRPR